VHLHSFDLRDSTASAAEYKEQDNQNGSLFHFPSVPHSRTHPLVELPTAYEHQNPLASVAWLIGLHLPGPGLPVVPQALQIQKSPWSSRKISRQGPAANCVQQPSKVHLAEGAALRAVVLLPMPEASNKVERTIAIAKT
jgi:hypothetical protein